MNNTNLMGRIVKDIELKTNNNGNNFTYLTIAINRNKEQADFINCVAWGKTAELLANYSKKGDQIAVVGRLETYTTERDGQKQTNMNVNVSQVHFVSAPKQEQKAKENNSFDDINFEDIKF